MGDHRCMPVHDGPFFFERAGVQRCDACKQLITDSQVVDAARALRGDRDGNAVQRERSLPRACEQLKARQPVGKRA